MINGIVNVYNEKDFTSHDVVAKLRGILKQKKIGHTGTLDPQAVGVLPVCLGNATKLCELLTDKEKTYQATLILGVTSDTEDMTGEVKRITSEDEVKKLDKEKIIEVIKSFVGEYNQVPPMYSALKVNGKKLYELAREGKEIERKPRKVEILDVDVSIVDLPKIVFTVTCSKGTYIRSLCRDIGEKLGVGGATSTGGISPEVNAAMNSLKICVRTAGARFSYSSRPRRFFSTSVITIPGLRYFLLRRRRSRNLFLLIPSKSAAR